MDTKGSIFRAGLSFLVRHPRWLILAVIAYVILPFDLMPEALLGPVGYLDDLVVMLLPLLLRGFAQKLENNATRSHPKPPKDYYDTTAR